MYCDWVGKLKGGKLWSSLKRTVVNCESVCSILIVSRGNNGRRNAAVTSLNCLKCQWASVPLNLCCWTNNISTAAGTNGYEMTIFFPTTRLTSLLQRTLMFGHRYQLLRPLPLWYCEGGGMVNLVGGWISPLQSTCFQDREHMARASVKLDSGQPSKWQWYA